MNLTGGYVLLLILCILASDYRVNSDQNTRLSRRKRYVVFPEGSTFSVSEGSFVFIELYIEIVCGNFQVALCVTMNTLSSDDIFSEGINWGIAYDLPNESKPALEPFLQLRHDQIKPVNKYGYPNAPLNKNVVKYPQWNSNEKYYVKPGKRKYYKPDYYYLQRRHRRELYNKLEVIMNA